jgi:pimeloyl-ACP methyl ester carboxylesterase
MDEAFYSVEGLRLRYLEWGNTRPDAIVLVHGFSSTADAWTRVGDVLGTDYHVVAPDLRGHGQSEWDPQERYSDERLAADVRALVQQLGLPPFTLVGHSMGGAVAFSYAATYPEDVRRLVIEDSAPLPPGRRLTELKTTFASRGEVEQSVRSANPTMSEAAVQGRVDVYYRQQPDGTWGFRADVVGVRHGRGENDAEKSWQNARKVQAPTLVIRAGAEPALVSGETAERLSRENPRIQVVTVPGAGHNIHFAHFDAFMTHLRQVLWEPVGAGRILT